MRIPGHTKRQKELARARKRQDKEARREQRRKEKAERANGAGPSPEDQTVLPPSVVAGPESPR